MDFESVWNTPSQSKNQSWIDRGFLYEKNQEEVQKQKLLEENLLKKYFKTNEIVEWNVFFEEIIRLIKCVTASTILSSNIQTSKVSFATVLIKYDFETFFVKFSSYLTTLSITFSCNFVYT